MAKRGTPVKAGPPRLSEWSPEVAALFELRDLTAAGIRSQYATRGLTPPEIPAGRRPRVALDDIEDERSAVEHDYLVAQMLPTPA